MNKSMGNSTSTAPNAKGSAAKQAWSGILLCVALLWIYGVLFGSSDHKQSVTARVQTTKAQWRNQHPNVILLQAGRAALKSSLGEPSSIQRVSDQEYWYYTCQDGSLQVVISNPTMGDIDLVVTAINEF